MAKKRNKEKWPEKKSWHYGLKQETKHSIWAVFSFTVCVLLTLAYLGEAGMVGEAVHTALFTVFGNGGFLVPMAFFLAGLSFLFALGEHIVATTVMGGILFLLSSLGLSDILFGEYTGGYVGFFSSYPFLRFFDFWASLVVFAALFLASLLIMLNLSLKWRKKEKEEMPQDVDLVRRAPELTMQQALNKDMEKATGGVKYEEEEEKDGEAPEKFSMFSVNSFLKKPQKQQRAEPQKLFSYVSPPLELLEDDKGTPSSGDIKANANIIKRTLQNFGIDVEMSEVNVGPSVTQYTLKPAEGIKLSRITALHNDLALALAAHPLRIEAPIPGRSLVGIEVPNRSIALVGLRSLIGLEEFKNAPSLTLLLGRDVSGSPIFADLAKMPHLLIAGATGSGKSIAIHTLIVSLLYKNSPEFLRFILIDPKRVELTAYKSLPHLLSPVITDAKRAITSLRWAVREMERRYEKLEEVGARDIISYNTEMIHEKTYDEILPNILIVIDELADLMAAYPREMEASIVRLAQMSRAVGIHLAVSTQRPSVEVITGLIKANITARVALQVASGVDSRTILDMSGAEKLLGNGDMLYLAGDTSKPKRIQGAFISDKEVKKVAAFIVESAEGFESEKIDLEAKLPSSEWSQEAVEENDIDDDLYEEAKELIIAAQKASASYLQRRLRVGYARAARLLDMLEERGVIGPGEGAKPRDVLMKKSDADKLIEDFDADRELEEIGDGKSENKEKKSARSTDDESVPYTDFDS